MSKCWRQSWGGGNLPTSVVTSVVSSLATSPASLVMVTSSNRLGVGQENLLVVAIGREVNHSSGWAHAGDGGLVKLFIL